MPEAEFLHAWMMSHMAPGFSGRQALVQLARHGSKFRSGIWQVSALFLPELRPLINITSVTLFQDRGACLVI